ncbi:MAG: bifunctional folylpolyglutamate synthase/dihydrofolate synthase [Acidimicrobiales bacterium]|nr:bifunctional folylpolyglutamate synthase/dihydrofolate synthase [Acidimicrobiales bacterium]
MNYASALAYLDAHINREASPAIAAGRVEGLSLEPIRRLMHVLGDPQTQYPVLHLTGTNGKGSVGEMITLLLEEHGLSVGTYSSPHLQRINERLRWTGDRLLDVDRQGEIVARRGGRRGGAISDEEFGRVIGAVADAEGLAGVRPSYFEILTAASLLWFSELPVDAAVIEVGLLGRFDATNVVDGEVAVITNIGPDHTDFSGNWRAAIAEEKSGIVKPGSFLVVGETDPELRPIFERAAGDRLWVRGQDFDVVSDRVAVRGRLLDLQTPGQLIEEVFLPLHGEHQGINAAVAVAAAEAFFARPLDPDVVRAAFARLHLAGRFEIAGRSPLLIIDGAHNPAGAAAVRQTLDEEFAREGRIVFVIGLLEGRDPDAMLEAFGVRHTDLVICCTPDSPRARPAEELGEICRSLALPVEVCPEVAAAVERAREVASDADVIIVTGSIYVAGAARDALGLAPPGME